MPLAALPQVRLPGGLPLLREHVHGLRPILEHGDFTSRFQRCLRRGRRQVQQHGRLGGQRYGRVLCLGAVSGADGQLALPGLKLCYIAPSLGGVETLITHPATVSYYRNTRKERYALGITDTLVRLAVGVEDAADIQADLDQALRRAMR